VKNNLLSRLAIFGVLTIFFDIIIISVITPSYSHLTQTISELNAKGADNAQIFNIFLTIGLASLAISSISFIKQRSTISKLSGFLIILSILITIVMNWFFPMDAIEGVRTSADKIHNGFITYAILIFLISQVLAIKFWHDENKKNIRNFTIILFSIALAFGFLSLVSNYQQSELINFSERGWMVCFLAYFVLLSSNVVEYNK